MHCPLSRPGTATGSVLPTESLDSRVRVPFEVPFGAISAVPTPHASFHYRFAPLMAWMHRGVSDLHSGTEQVASGCGLRSVLEVGSACPRGHRPLFPHQVPVLLLSTLQTEVLALHLGPVPFGC